MKILHISHHVGCMRDHAYIYNQLNADFTFWKFTKGVFYITKELADSLWIEKKDYFNTFDFVVTSDTAPLSRIIMEHIDEFKGTLVVWICNRFDYNMERDSSFYALFKRCSIENKEKVKIIPYSDFEGIWCGIKGIQSISQTITPIGINPRILDFKIDCLQELSDSYTDDTNSKEKYDSSNKLQGKIFIPIYGNDNIFYKLNDVLSRNNLQCFNGGYSHPEDLKNCLAFVTFPDAFSKLITFETIQNEVIVFLPSKKFLIQLHPTSNNGTSYWFNNPLGNLNKETIEFCEWYRYDKCRIYFDSIDDMVLKIKTLDEATINEKKHWCRTYGKEIEEKSMKAWKEIFVII